MQPPTVREVTKRLVKEGWELTRCKDGRRIYRKNGKIVPIHGKDKDPIKRGTYKAIKEQAGW
ncbi:MAG: type II toxin-antitoxin system HicA family toxin [Raoultibacter sp.]